MADKSEVFCWLKSFSPGMKLERLSLQFETKGFRWRRSLVSVKTEDLDSFFPFPDKLLIGTLSTENFHNDGDVGGRKRLRWGRRFSRQKKQTTMATATRTRKKKRSNWQNNSSARAFHNFVHFLAVPCKTATWNHHNLRRLRTETATANYFNFH